MVYKQSEISAQQGRTLTILDPEFCAELSERIPGYEIQLENL